MKFQPRYYTEEMLRSEFYRICVLLKIPCFLEYKSKWNGISGSCFDAVIYKDTEILAIIEVKLPYSLPKNSWELSEQCKRYETFGVPVFLIVNVEDIIYLMPKLLKLMK